ncbi:GMC oxidoreductase [Leisingera sp. NJS204]|uniref:GMC oxidoreductase n=1 Tax=Leisingera sp. NJS204 TaxID=2508307 RepID=UPI00101079A7|nr:GMC family oxidoreductase [Leisingera sp. NJS204]QAX32119.1 GMC family oxidoreductase [Leisingera sp. NJS204]
MPLVTIQAALERQYDACIVGSGPAGLAVALPLAEAGRSVLVLEAGGHAPSPGPGAALEDPGAHMASADTHCQGLGGTSSLWGGRIVPLAAHDFEMAGWPLPFAGLAPYFADAADFLGGHAPPQPFLRPGAAGNFDLDATEVLADSGSLMRWHQAGIDAPGGPDVLLQANAVGLELGTGADGRPRCAGVRVRQQDGAPAASIRAGTTVLAQGGIETARLLLAAQARHRAELGHLAALGQYYAGHLTGSIASIVFPSRTDAAEYGWRRGAARGLSRRVFRSTPEAMAEGVNMFFWTRNWPAANAGHGSGILSAKHLLARLRGRSTQEPAPLGPGAPERLQQSPLLPHLRNLAADAGPSLRALPGLIRARYDRGREAVDHLILNGANRYKLSYHAEQEPLAANRIELAGPVQPDILPEIRIRFGFSQVDVERVVRGHGMLAAALAASGLARLQYDVPPQEQPQAIRASAMDGYHQTGMARMGRDPRDSVVDGDCRVHGVQGLYLAGSAIFRSSGAAQPTQSIAAFSMRLARHLAAAKPAPRAAVERGCPAAAAQ